jgi:integrase
VEALPRRIDTPLLFTTATGQVIDLHNWRAREWYPALRRARIVQRGPNALRHTYATRSLEAGVDRDQLAHEMGTSVAMLEATYLHLRPVMAQHATRLRDAYDAAETGQLDAAESGDSADE